MLQIRKFLYPITIVVLLIVGAAQSNLIHTQDTLIAKYDLVVKKQNEVIEKQKAIIDANLNSFVKPTYYQRTIYYARNGVFNNEDLLLLAQLINHEAKGEALIGQIAVGAVVMQRVKNEKFPDTIRDVILAPGQFCDVSKLVDITPTDENIEAAKYAMQGADPTGGALYFYNPKTSTSKWIFTRHVLTTIGRHRFAI
jgi:N-acetylmuramoyl-L-alanine amidase